MGLVHQTLPKMEEPDALGISLIKLLRVNQGSDEVLVDTKHEITVEDQTPPGWGADLHKIRLIY